MTLFVEDFDHVDPVPPPDSGRDDAEITGLLAAEYARGMAEGIAQAKAECDAGTALLIERCAAEFRAADESIAAMVESAADQLARVVFEMLGSLVPTICAACGPAEITALTQVLLPRLRSEPRIRVRLNPHDVAVVQAQLDQLPDDLPERIAVASDDAVARGDIRIAWQDGALLRDTSAIWRDMSGALQQFGFLDAPPPRERTPRTARPGFERPDFERPDFERPDFERMIEHAR